MDASRFDRFARTFAAPRSRRRLLAAVVGAGLGLVTRPPAAAADCPVLSPCWLRGRLTPWGGDGVSLGQDAAIGINPVDLVEAAIASPSEPEPGLCAGDDCGRDTDPATRNCPSGLTECGGRCVDLGYDRTNCGACGFVCPYTWGCGGGSCVCTSWCTRRTCTTYYVNGKAEVRCTDEVYCC